MSINIGIFTVSLLVFLCSKLKKISCCDFQIMYILFILIPLTIYSGFVFLNPADSTIKLNSLITFESIFNPQMQKMEQKYSELEQKYNELLKLKFNNLN